MPCAAPGRRARTSLPGLSSALASPPPGGLPGRLALGCPRSLGPGPTILPSPGFPSSDAARQRCLRRKCRERLRPLARGSAHSRGWKSWRRRLGASPPGRSGPGDLPPYSLSPVAPHLLRGPHSTLIERLPRPGGSLPAPSHANHVVEGWFGRRVIFLLAGDVLLNLSSYFHFYLNGFIS